MTDERLVRKGMGEPREGVAQQARVSHGLWLAHQDALADAGFTKEEGRALEKAALELESAASVQAEARGDSKGKTQEEVAAQSDAKVLIRKIRNSAPLALRKHPVAGVTVASFNAGDALARTTGKISAYLGKIAAPSATAADAFKPYFGGKNLGQLVTEAKKNLDRADTTQEVTVASVPAETQKVYEAKGRALELIEDLNRVARNAFDGNAVVVSQFNKDVLLRARKVRPAKEVVKQ